MGTTVAGVARVPFQVGIDRYLPAAFGKIHPRWKTPYISILVQAVLSGGILLVSQINETTRGAYQFLIDAGDHSLLHSVSLHVCRRHQAGTAAKIARRIRMRCWSRAAESPVCGSAADWDLLVVWSAFFVSLVPPGDSANKLGFELKLVVGTVVSILIGLVLYWRGAREKLAEQ